MALPLKYSLKNITILGNFKTLRWIMRTNGTIYCKVGLLSHKMIQITELKSLEDGNSEYDVRSCPKKDHNHIAYFLCGHGVMLYRENRIFTPFFNFFVPFFILYPENNQFDRK